MRWVSSASSAASNRQRSTAVAVLGEEGEVDALAVPRGALRVGGTGPDPHRCSEPTRCAGPTARATPPRQAWPRPRAPGAAPPFVRRVQGELPAVAVRRRVRLRRRRRGCARASASEPPSLAPRRTSRPSLASSASASAGTPPRSDGVSRRRRRSSRRPGQERRVGPVAGAGSGWIRADSNVACAWGSGGSPAHSNEANSSAPALAGPPRPGRVLCG